MSDIYFDTSLFIRYFMPRGSSNDAEIQLNRVHKGDTGVISMLVLMEMVDVIRKQITSSEPFNGNTDEERKKIKEKVRNKVNEYVGQIVDLAKQNKIKIKDPNTPVDNHFKSSFAILQSLDYKIFDYSTCGVCGQPIPNKYSPKSLGQYDIQHALIAKWNGCSEIVTADRSFKQLEKNPDFKGILITVIK